MWGLGGSFFFFLSCPRCIARHRYWKMVFVINWIGSKDWGVRGSWPGSVSEDSNQSSDKWNGKGCWERHCRRFPSSLRIGNKACGGSRGGRSFKRGKWRDRNAMVKERKCVERRTFARTLESSAGHFASRVSEVVASMSFEFQLFKNCPHGFWNRGWMTVRNIQGW